MVTSMIQYIDTSAGLTTTGHKIKALKMVDYDLIRKAAQDIGYEKATPRSIYIADRDRLLMRIMYECGTRISSTLLMTIDSINKKECSVRFEQQKKRRFTMHEVVITQDLRDALIDYIVRNTNIIAKNGGRLFGITREAFEARLKLYSKIAGLDKVSAHAFRHGCAMNMLMDGVPINIVSYRLGHSNVNITASTYAVVTPDIERMFLQEANGGYEI